MARTAEKVRSLVAEDPAMADALSVVLSRADGTGDPEGGDDSDGGGAPDNNGTADDENPGDGGSSGRAASDGGSAHTVAWGEVSDDLTSGQWGRLIQTGILTDRDGEGFAVADPEGVREGLADPEDEGDDEGSGWTIYDKLAGLAAISLAPAYFITSLTNAVGETMDLFIGPIHSVLPFYAVVIVLSVFTGLYSALLQSNMMNMGDMNTDQSETQERLSEITDEIEAAQERGDDAAVERLRSEQMEMMGESLGMFKQMFRSMVWIMLLTIPVFIWMYWEIGVRGASGQLADDAGIVLPLLGERGWQQAAIGPIRVWIVWYFLCSIGFRQVIQKSLNLRTSPTG